MRTTATAELKPALQKARTSRLNIVGRRINTFGSQHWLLIWSVVSGTDPVKLALRSILSVTEPMSRLTRGTAD